MEEITVAQAFDVIKEAVQKDEGYAWTWHCNVAVPFMDKGLSHLNANLGAATFMSIAFNVDMFKHPLFEHTKKYNEETCSFEYADKV